MVITNKTSRQQLLLYQQRAEKRISGELYQHVAEVMADHIGEQLRWMSRVSWLF